MYLLDTNAVSAIRKIKSGKCNLNFELWLMRQANDDLFINSVVLYELKKGALLKRHNGDIKQADMLDAWIVGTIMPMFQNRILPFDEKCALVNAELNVPNARPQYDSVLAATALAHDLVLITENVKDFENIPNLRIVNPFI